MCILKVSSFLAFENASEEDVGEQICLVFTSASCGKGLSVKLGTSTPSEICYTSSSLITGPIITILQRVNKI